MILGTSLTSPGIMRSIVGASIWLLCAMPPCHSQNTSTPQDFERMGQIAGTYKGDSDEHVKSSLAHVDGCARIQTSASYTLTLDVDQASGRGKGTMEIHNEFQAEYIDPFPSEEKKDACLRKAVGSTDSDTGDNDVTYSVSWEFRRFNKRRIELSMRETDCSGVCGELGNLYRDADVYASGDIMYLRPRGGPIRLSRQ
jgi:hypothetical protein